MHPYKVSGEDVWYLIKYSAEALLKFCSFQARAINWGVTIHDWYNLPDLAKKCCFFSLSLSWASSTMQHIYLNTTWISFTHSENNLPWLVAGARASLLNQHSNVFIFFSLSWTTLIYDYRFTRTCTTYYYSAHFQIPAYSWLNPYPGNRTAFEMNLQADTHLKKQSFWLDYYWNLTMSIFNAGSSTLRLLLLAGT